MHFKDCVGGGVGYYGWVEGRMGEGCLVNIVKEPTIDFQYKCTYGCVSLTTMRIHRPSSTVSIFRLLAYQRKPLYRNHC